MKKLTIIIAALVLGSGAAHARETDQQLISKWFACHEVNCNREAIAEQLQDRGWCVWPLQGIWYRCNQQERTRE